MRRLTKGAITSQIEPLIKVAVRYTGWATVILLLSSLVLATIGQFLEMRFFPPKEWVFVGRTGVLALYVLELAEVTLVAFVVLKLSTLFFKKTPSR